MNRRSLFAGLLAAPVVAASLVASGKAESPFAPAASTPTEPHPVVAINITGSGSRYSRAEIEALIRDIDAAVADGALLGRPR